MGWGLVAQPRWQQSIYRVLSQEEVHGGRPLCAAELATARRIAEAEGALSVPLLFPDAAMFHDEHLSP